MAVKQIISSLLAVYRRELQSYFAAPLAYVIATIFWLLGGFFLVLVLLSPEGLLALTAQREQGTARRTPEIDVADDGRVRLAIAAGALLGRRSGAEPAKHVVSLAPRRPRGLRQLRARRATLHPRQSVAVTLLARSALASRHV